MQVTVVLLYLCSIITYVSQLAMSMGFITLQQLLTHDHKRLMEDLLQHTLTFKAAKQEPLQCTETPTDNITTVAQL